MPPVQTTYGANLAAAVAGMIANQEPKDVMTRILENGPVGYGIGVFQGSAADRINPDGDGRVFRGVTLLDKTVRPDQENPDNFSTGDNVPVMVKGCIWVTVQGNVSPGQSAYVGDDGELSAVASGNVAIPNAIWDTAASDGQLAILRLK